MLVWVVFGGGVVGCFFDCIVELWGGGVGVRGWVVML